MTDAAPEEQQDSMPTPTPPEPKPPATDGKDWQAEADKWKSLSRKNEEAAKANAAAAKRLEELEAANKSELERAVDAARKEGESAAQQRANARLVAAEARAAAASKQFRDASDAVRFLDLSAVAVNDDGDVDADAIGKQLDQLAKEKPYLLNDPRPTRPQGDVGQGPRHPVAPEVTPGLGRLRAAYTNTPN